MLLTAAYNLRPVSSVIGEAGSFFFRSDSPADLAGSGLSLLEDETGRARRGPIFQSGREPMRSLDRTFQGR